CRFGDAESLPRRSGQVLVRPRRFAPPHNCRSKLTQTFAPVKCPFASAALLIRCRRRGRLLFAVLVSNRYWSSCPHQPIMKREIAASGIERGVLRKDPENEGASHGDACSAANPFGRGQDRWRGTSSVSAGLDALGLSPDKRSKGKAAQGAHGCEAAHRSYWRQGPAHWKRERLHSLSGRASPSAPQHADRDELQDQPGRLGQGSRGPHRQDSDSNRRAGLEDLRQVVRHRKRGRNNSDQARKAAALVLKLPRALLPHKKSRSFLRATCLGKLLRT